jgi:hypothetical protein
MFCILGRSPKIPNTRPPLLKVSDKTTTTTSLFLYLLHLCLMSLEDGYHIYKVPCPSVRPSVRAGAGVRQSGTTGPGPTKRDPAHVQQRCYAAKIPFLPGPGLPECVACVRLSRSWNPGPESRISRSWNPGSWNPVSVYRGPETQVLRAKCGNTAATEEGSRVRLSESWNPAVAAPKIRFSG